MEEALASIDSPLPVPSRPPQSTGTTVLAQPLSPPQVPHTRKEIEPFGLQTPPPLNSQQQQFNNQNRVISPDGSQYKSFGDKSSQFHLKNGSPEYHGLNINSPLLTLDTSSLHLDTSPNGGIETSQHQLFFTNQVSSQPNVPVSPTFKQQIEEHEKLVKDNFNLRLKLYYMDEKLRTMCENGNEGQEAVVHELIDTRAILEERVKDIEYRDQLLSQAQSAIEGLSEEVEYLKRWEGGDVDSTGTKTKEPPLPDVNNRSEDPEVVAQLQSKLVESQNQLNTACSEVEHLRNGLDGAMKDAERLRKAEESSKSTVIEKEMENLSLRKALSFYTEKTTRGNDFVDSGVENPEEKEGLQQRLQEYENKLNASTFERDRANIKLGKANCELDKLRGDLEMRKRLLIGSYKDLVGCSNNLGEQTECGVEQEICAALASLTRELNASKSEISRLQGLLAVANHGGGHEKAQQLEGEAAILKMELERERDRRGANNQEGYEKVQRLEGEVSVLRRELERERDRGEEQHDLVRTLQRSLELAQSKLVTSNSRNAELRGELEATLSKLATSSDSYDLRNQLGSISSELASTKILCSKQQGELLSYKKEIDKLTCDIATQSIIKQEVTSLQRDLEASKNEASSLHDQLKTAQADAVGVVGDKNEETLHLRQELEGLHSQLESQSIFQDRLEVNVKEMSMLQCNLQAKSAELESNKKEMKRMQVSLETKTLELENSNKKVASLHKRIQLEHEESLQAINRHSVRQSMKGGSNDENRITDSSFPESHDNTICRNCVAVREGLIRFHEVMTECFGPSTATSRRLGRESFDNISSKSTLELLSSMEEVVANARGEHKRIKSAVRSAASSAKVQSEKCTSAIRSLENRVHNAELRVEEIHSRRIPHRPTYPRRPPYWEKAPSSGAALGQSLSSPLLLMGEKGNLLYELNCRLHQLRKILPACEGLVERSEALVQKGSNRYPLTDRRGNNLDIGGELLDLLDSNARVTKQLYTLGVDCQRVYGRFKAVMEWEGDRKCDDLYTVGRELEDLASSLKTLTGGSRT